MQTLVHQQSPQQRVKPLTHGTFLGLRPSGAVAVWLSLALMVMAGYAVSFEEVPVTPQQREEALKRVISIGGHSQLKRREIHHGVVFDNLPPALSSEMIKSAMASRKAIPIYTHNPILGPETAAVTIIEMTDLSCRTCMATVQKITALRDAFGDDVRIVHKHLPSDLYTPTNTAAFYAKLAQKHGLFWEYRYRLSVLQTEITEDTYNQQLIKLGVDVPSMQSAIRSNARQFYRELDADALQAKALGESVPAVFYVNGVRIGPGSVPIGALEDLIKYEIESAQAKHNDRMPRSKQ